MYFTTSVRVVFLLVIYLLLAEANAGQTFWRVTPLQEKREDGRNLFRYEYPHTLIHYDTKTTNEYCEQLKDDNEIDGKLYYIELTFKQTTLDAFCSLVKEDLNKVVRYLCHIDMDGVHLHVFRLIFVGGINEEIKTFQYTVTTHAILATRVTTIEMPDEKQCKHDKLRLWFRRWLYKTRASKIRAFIGTGQPK